MAAERTVVLGGGLAGLSAGCMLSREGEWTTVIESSPEIGGLARTEKWRGCLFDLGGHRFHTTNAELLAFVKDLMGRELISVPRSSKICLKGRYFDYPLRPMNALAGLGPKESLAILFDYAWEKMKAPWHSRPPRSLRDKVVRDFGERLFRIFFRDYSEKVWGLSCDSISADWIAKRIQGLSLGGAIQNALMKKSGSFPATLDDSFYYPARGIGRISDRLCEEVLKCGSVLTDTRVAGVHHNGSTVHGLTLRGGRGESFMPADAFLSTIPLPGLIRMLRPQPPADILRVLSGLRYRDLLVVALLVDRPRVTDQTWVYFPERKVPFGRLHEPKNWSADMAPPDRTVVVTEYFCFAGDKTWTTGDDKLAEQTATALENMDFLRPGELLDAKILRVPKAYPLFDIEYLEKLDVVRTSLEGFKNLYCAGRTGTFGYLNMDEALESGMGAAAALLNDRRWAGRVGGATVEGIGATAVTVP
jgi:protoporphyrinogen oxidase